MMIKLQNLYGDNAPVITAHRGASGIEPENTMRAFRRAVELGADIVEFDVRATADGELVIMHDRTLDRTTDGHGPVNAAAWSAIGGLNASYWEDTHDQGRRLGIPLHDDVHVPLYDARLKAYGLRSNVFFANTADDMREVLSHGVSGFLTDRCDLAVSFRNRCVPQ